MSSKKPLCAVFLDRDGVLNRCVIRNGKPYPPGSAQEVEILPYVGAGLRKLKNAGFMNVVVTNQPDVARGTQSREAVEEINAFLMERLALDKTLVCYHDDEDACRCRKPLPGMLLTAAEIYGIDLSGSFMIGDRWKDIDAGRSAGCRTILIEHEYAERPPSNPPDMKAKSLLEAAAWIISHQRRK